MKKLLSLSLILSLGLATVTPALNAVAQSQSVVQSQANPADASGWQAAKKWWRSGRNMKALNAQEQRAFRDLRKNFTIGAIIAVVTAMIASGAALAIGYKKRQAGQKEPSVGLAPDAYAARPAARIGWQAEQEKPADASSAADDLGQELIQEAPTYVDAVPYIVPVPYVDAVPYAAQPASASDTAAQAAWLVAFRPAPAVAGYLGQELRDAAERGDENRIKDLLKRRADVNATDQERETALMKAAEKGRENIVRLLLQAGAEVNVANTFGWTALIEAVFWDRVDIVKLLLQKGADVNVQNQNGFTALMYAASHGNENIVKDLLKRGANVNVQDRYTALMLAAKNGHENIVKDLLQVKGINVNAANSFGWTALMWAAREGHENIVKLLLQAEADRETALVWATYGGHENIVKLLLQEGADVNARDKNGNTALMEAAAGGHIGVVDLLLQAGIDVNIKNNAGKTAYDLAKTQEIKNMIKRARLWQVQRELERPAGGTSRFENLPRDMIGEIMKRVEDVEFPE